MAAVFNRHANYMYKEGLAVENRRHDSITIAMQFINLSIPAWVTHEVASALTRFGFPKWAFE